MLIASLSAPWGLHTTSDHKSSPASVQHMIGEKILPGLQDSNKAELSSREEDETNPESVTGHTPVVATFGNEP